MCQLSDPTLQKMLSNLPIAGIKEELQGMVSDLGKTSCRGESYWLLHDAVGAVATVRFLLVVAPSKHCYW